MEAVIGYHADQPLSEAGGSAQSAAKKTPSHPDPDPHPGEPTAEDENDADDK